MSILACSASDAIDPEVFMVAAVLFYAACLIGLLALISKFTLRKHPDIVLALSILTVVLAIFPFLFCSHIYSIDYVAIGGDGTRASPPFWKALWLPALPIFVGSTLTVLSLSAQRRKVKIPQTRQPLKT